MINILREQEVSKSLQTDEIKQYLDDLAEYKNDPEHKKKPEKPSRNCFLENHLLQCYAGLFQQ